MRHPYTIANPGVRITPAGGSATVAIPATSAFNVDGTTPKKAQWVMIYVEDDFTAFQFVDSSGEVVVATTGIKISFNGQNPMAFNVGGASHIATIQNGGAGFLRIYPLEDQ